MKAGIKPIYHKSDMAKKQRKKRSNKPEMLFSARNYQLLVLGAVLIGLGFLIMYLENEVLGFFSLYVSPIMILAGYGVILASLLVQKNKDQTQTQTASE